MVPRRLIPALLVAGSMLACSVVGAAGGTTVSSPLGHAASAMAGPFAFNVAVDETTGHAFVLSASTDTQDITESPAGRSYLTMLDVQTGRLLRTVEVSPGSYALGVDSRAGHAFVAGQGRVSMVDTRTGVVLRTVAMGDQPGGTTAAGALALAVASHAGRLFVETSRGAGQASLLMLDTHTGTLLRTVPRGLNGASCSCLPGDLMAVDESTGRLFLAPEPTGNTVRVLDAHSGMTLRTVALGGAIVGIALDEPDARVLVETATPQRYGVSILDARSGTIRRTLTVGTLTLATSTIALSILQSRLGPYLRAGIVVDTRTGHAFVIRGGTHRDGTMHTGNGVVTMLDARSGTVLRTTPIANDPFTAVVDAHLGRLLVASTSVSDGPAAYRPTSTVSTFETQSGALAHSVGMPSLEQSYFLSIPLAVATRAGRAFLVDKHHNSVRVLETRSGILLQTVSLHPVQAPHASP